MRKLLFIILLFSLNSCAVYVRYGMGVRKPRNMTDKEIGAWASKIGIDQFPLYSLDTSYFSYLHQTYPTAPLVCSEINGNPQGMAVKNLNQPIMIMWLDHGTLKSLTINCCFPAVLNIQWNKFGYLDDFPPKGCFSDTVYNKISLAGLRNYLHPLNAKASAAMQGDYHSYLVVFADKMINKQCKRLIKLLKKNFAGHENDILFVNDDNYWKHSM